jgi:predicted peptidase
MFKLILASVLLALSPGCVPAAGTRPINPVLLAKFEAHVFKDGSGHPLRYRLFKPSGYDARTNYPLVLFLHGAAGIGDDNARQFNGGNEVPPLALTADGAQARFPCFVLAPQCPRGGSWSSLNDQPTEMIRLTMAAIESLKGKFRIDPRRIYLVGVSMGGHGVWDVAGKFQKTFAAAVPICGAGEPAKAAKLVKLPVWCFHGAADTTVNVNYARRMIAALRKAGGNPKYTEYPGVGHDSYRNAFLEPELLPWLFAQKHGE